MKGKPKKGESEARERGKRKKKKQRQRESERRRKKEKNKGMEKDSAKWTKQLRAEKNWHMKFFFVGKTVTENDRK